MSKRKKAADEIFCRSCGEVIKTEAEICPKCGVKNSKSTSTRTGSRGSPSNQSTTTTHDPSNYETTVGENWYYAVAVPTVLSPLSFGVFMSQPSNSVISSIAMVTLLIGTFAPIIGLYFDRQYVRANSEWHPSRLWMVGFFFLYIVNFALAGFYLYRRYEVLGKPSLPD